MAEETKEQIIQKCQADLIAYDKGGGLEAIDQAVSAYNTDKSSIFASATRGGVDLSGLDNLSSNNLSTFFTQFEDKLNVYEDDAVATLTETPEYASAVEEIKATTFYSLIGGAKAASAKRQEFFDKCIFDASKKDTSAAGTAAGIAAAAVAGGAPAVAVAVGSVVVGALAGSPDPASIPTAEAAPEVDLLELPSYKQSLLYKEQCILTNNITNIIDFHAVSNSQRNTDHKKNLLMLNNQDPSSFINKLVSYPSQEFFFDSLTPLQRSSMMPRIELIKVISTNEKGTDEDEFKIPFESHTNYNSFLTNRGQRATGIGLKSFSVDLNGNNPFAAKRSITAKLQIVAANFSELSKERSLTTLSKKDGKRKIATFRYLDFALKTSNNIKPNPKNDILNFRLKAVVGWKNPGLTNPYHSSTLREAINTSFMTLNLIPVKHEFDFSDNGSGKVTFTISYQSYIDNFYEHPSFGIFSSPQAKAKKQEFDDAIEAEVKKKCPSGITKEQIEQIDEAIKAITQQYETDSLKLKTDQFKELQKSLLSAEKIYVLSLTRNQLLNAIDTGELDFEAIIEEISVDSGTGSDAAAAAATSALSGSGGGLLDPTKNEVIQSNLTDLSKENILFFYVRDLFDIIFNKISDNVSEDADSTKYLKKLKLVLGPIEIGAKEAQPSTIINIGQIPVSFKSFVSWISTKIISIDKDDYPIMAFIRSFLNEFIVDYFNDRNCYKRGNKTQAINLMQNFITSYNDLEKDLEAQSSVATSFGSFDALPKSRPLLSVAGASNDPRPEYGFDSEHHYLCFHAGNVLPREKMKGIRSEDHNRGIYHFKTGMNKGIIHTITLKRTNATFLPEVKFETSGFDGLKQLIDVYDVNIKMDGFFNIYPGQYIYVDPAGFDPSNNVTNLTELGVGGYCMITNISHTIIPKCVTTVTARWTAPKSDSDTPPYLKLSTTTPSVCSPTGSK